MYTVVIGAIIGIANNALYISTHTLTCMYECMNVCMNVHVCMNVCMNICMFSLCMHFVYIYVCIEKQCMYV